VFKLNRYALILFLSACQPFSYHVTAVDQYGNTQKAEGTPTEMPIPTDTATPSPLGQHSYTDRIDDHPLEYQFHVLYVINADTQNAVRDIDGSIDENVKLMNEWFSSQSTGTTFRFDTYQQELDITLVTLPITEAGMFDYVKKQYSQHDERYDGMVFLHDGLEDWLERLNQIRPFMQTGKIYVAYYEISKSFTCGDSAGAGKRVIGMYPSAFSMRDDSECAAAADQSLDNERGLWEHILAHEIIHSLGFANSCATHAIQKDIHIDDPATPTDIMGVRQGLYATNPVLDPNHDDYYMTNLDCPDLADSPFLEPLPEKQVLPEGVLTESWRLP